MGENKKVAKMVLKVDLQCEKCYRKVKKVLCKFPQIRDQAYDEKNNQVIIKVVCCSPEKIRDKLCCKGGCVIKSINIIEPPVNPPPPTPPVEPPPPTPRVEPPPPTPPVKPPPHPMICMCPLVTCMCPWPPGNTCCRECYGGHPGGPCQTGCGYVVQVYDSYGGWRSYYTRSYCVIRPDCFSEENPQACAIM